MTLDQTILELADAEAWLNLPMNLEQSGEGEEAATAYRRVIALSPGSQLSAKAEAGCTRLTTSNFRRAGGEFRPDVLTYCVEALKLFEKMPEDEVKQIAMEIRMLGTKGLAVNDPAKKYTLRTLPGEFSALHLLCLQYVGFQLIDPTIDTGFDISDKSTETKRQLHGNDESE